MMSSLEINKFINDRKKHLIFLLQQLKKQNIHFFFKRKLVVPGKGIQKDRACPAGKAKI